ncbi:MFS general substrate transporter [Violaceomyces palustris]|uniref:MFS general substrate transporter n=1 Tax=Violaceomyces palustris TaxID=1673888 RepID=A0ACD0NQQ0_9BASI|nr:MFS general substrate transporter [Violaceomyces palustris]
MSGTSPPVVTLPKLENGRSPSEVDGSFKETKSNGDASSFDGDYDELARFYEPPDSYESKHRWDPAARWSAEEQGAILKRLDYKVALMACICFAALQLDRGNISNALSDGMLNDLHLTTDDYNTGQTIFYVCFLAAELPSQLISKKLGSDVWIPIQMMSWSVVAMCQAAIKGKESFYATRALIGLLEGGFIADTILYLSYFYTSAELTIRLSFFWVSYKTTDIIGSLLAAGLLKLRGHHGLEGWRWLFLIEGVITFAIGVWTMYYLPASPTQTTNRFRSKPWFSEREEVIIVNKVLRDDPTKSSMHNRQGLGFGDLWASFTDYDLWPLYLLGLTVFIAPGTVQAYFTLTLKSLGFSTFQTNLLTIPSGVLFIIGNLGLAYSSKKLNERTLVASITAWWHFILLIVLVLIPDGTNKWAKWAILSLFVGYPYCHPLLVSMNSMNAGSVRTRTFASSVYNMHVQAASLIASNIYRANDKPYYHRGNRVLLGISASSIVIFFLTKAYYIYRNKQKSKIWDSMTLEQKQDYIANTTDKGNKRLDFKFLH